MEYFMRNVQNNNSFSLEMKSVILMIFHIIFFLNSMNLCLQIFLTLSYLQKLQIQQFIYFEKINIKKDIGEFITKKMDNKQEKQNFLFKQIIQQNYDPQQFQQYMLMFKQGVDDLDKWSMQQLRQVVKDFKGGVKINKDKKQEVVRSAILDEQNQNLPNQLKQQIQEKKQASQKRVYTALQQQVSEGVNSRQSTIILKEEGKYLEYDYKSKHQIFSQTIECIVIPPNSLLTKDIEVKIQNFNKKQGGLFQQSYVSYTIFTPFLGTRVQRRYSDFQWLKKNLQILHPGLPVPPIAKKGQFRRYDDKHLWKRKLILEMFLNKLMQIPQLKAQIIIESFLKITDKVQFEKFKAGFKGLTTPNQLKNLKNMKGKVNLSIEPRINSFLVRSQRNLTQTQPEIKKMYKQFKGAATLLEGCGQTLKGIAALCEDLNKKDEIFRKKVQLKYCPNNIFTSIGQATIRLADQLQKQAKTFRQLFHSLLKYQSLHMINMLDSFDVLAEYQRNYQTTKNALIRKKLRLYEQGNVSKWGISQNLSQKLQKTKAIQIMLPKQTKQLQKLREKYALHNFQLYEQMNRFYSSKNLHIGKYLQEYCRLQTKISSQMMMIWVDMETNVMAMRQNKYIQKC